MGFDRFIASPLVRVLAALLASIFVVVAFFHLRSATSAAWETSLTPVFAAGIAAAIGFIFSFRRVYDVWMQMAHVLGSVMSAILFGACFLFFVPLFAVIIRFSDTLKARANRGEGQTYWIQRRRGDDDPTSYQRMG